MNSQQGQTLKMTLAWNVKHQSPNSSFVVLLTLGQTKLLSTLKWKCSISKFSLKKAWLALQSSARLESDSITAVNGQQRSSEHQEMQLIQILFLYMYKKINWQLMLHDLLHTGNGLEFNCYNYCSLLLLLLKWKDYCICYLGMNCWLKVKWNLTEYSVRLRHQQGSLVHGSATQMLPMLKVAMENCLSFHNMNRLVVNINLVINLFQGVALKIVK